MSEQKYNQRVYSFKDKLEFSRGQREKTDILTLEKLIPGCLSVLKTDTITDKKGIDYIATLRGGANIFIDAKTREKGCSKFWKGEPELAPELWSVCPGGKYQIQKERAKAGWTLNETTLVDYIYCTFDPFDCVEVFLLPFQLYRIAFRKKIHQWQKEYFMPPPQDSGEWQSQCIFIPVSVVLNAITAEMKPLSGGNHD